MVIDRRFLIEESLDQVKSEVRSILEDLVKTRESFRYQLNDLFEVIPTMTEKDSPVVQQVAQVVPGNGVRGLQLYGAAVGGLSIMQMPTAVQHGA